VADTGNFSVPSSCLSDSCTNPLLSEKFPKFQCNFLFLRCNSLCKILTKTKLSSQLLELVLSWCFNFQAILGGGSCFWASWVLLEIGVYEIPMMRLKSTKSLSCIANGVPLPV
jgi:hypothetical protein